MNRRQLIQLLSGTTLLPFMPQISLANTQNRRVILVELSGANDGLNTVVPHKDDRYHELRPTIGLKASATIELEQEFGLNNAMQKIMPLWERGEMAVTHGLGYPNPNRSHFASIALWETGSDGNKKRRDGWVTHDIEHAYAQASVDAHGISLSGKLNIFNSSTGNWLGMKTANQFSNRGMQEESQNTQGQIAEGRNAALKLLADRAKTLNRSIGLIAKKVDANQNPVAQNGSNPFDSQIVNAINLINAGVDAPVIKISLNGFDTHNAQVGRQSRLLTQLSSGIAKLRRELKKTDNWNNTVALTYSEFGRRAAENLSSGTDHGTAAAHFIFGGNIGGGLHGDHPDLGNLVDEDMVHTMDYRALYSSVLSDWLKLPSDQFADYQDSRLSQLFN